MPTLELTTEQQAGQRLMVGFEGRRINDQLRFLIGDLHIGGLILFAPNIESPAQLTRLCRQAQDYARQCGLPPLFIAVDQEGGLVARLKAPFTQFPGNPHIQNRTQAVRFGEITARELTAVGINMDCAPVLDTAFDPETSVMAQRAFSHDPQQVADLGLAVIGALQAGGVLAVAKHFPGIGRTVLDSHQERPELDITLEELAATDILPFRQAVGFPVSGVMLAHILYPQLDPHWPASLSPLIARDLLRDQMGFGGLLLTDDLDMGAVVKHYAPATVIRQVAAAEIDLILVCHWSAKIETAHRELCQGLLRNEDLNLAGQRCLERILAAKARYLA